MPRWQKITVAGVGLLGGSIGMAAKQRRLAGRISGLVRRPESVAECLEAGAVDEAFTDPVRAVEGAGARISSVMTFGADEGGRELVLRLGTIDPRPAVKALTAAGYQVKNGVRSRGHSG